MNEDYFDVLRNVEAEHAYVQGYILATLDNKDADARALLEHMVQRLGWRPNEER